MGHTSASEDMNHVAYYTAVDDTQLQIPVFNLERGYEMLPRALYTLAKIGVAASNGLKEIHLQEYFI